MNQLELALAPSGHWRTQTTFLFTITIFIPSVYVFVILSDVGEVFGEWGRYWSSIGHFSFLQTNPDRDFPYVYVPIIFCLIFFAPFSFSFFWGKRVKGCTVASMHLEQSVFFYFRFSYCTFILSLEVKGRFQPVVTNLSLSFDQNLVALFVTSF